jgi:CheY-like chemotaxis protein
VHDVHVPVDLNKVVEHAVSLTAPKWQGTKRAEGVQITVKAELADIPPVAGTASELREMLTNFIFNSVDAMPQGGVITVCTRVEGAKILLAVTDTGIGMDSEERARCLEPFFTTKGEHGTGLGLAVVYGIVQRHNGIIDVISEKGQGTTISVTFPATSITAHPSIELPLAVETSRKVLVADDQEIICELLAEYLRADGHEVTLATCGTDALEKFRAGEFDVVVTDQSMPGLNGVQVAAAIKSTRPDLPVILLTGFGDEMLATGHLPPEVDLVVSKPVSTADLRRALVRVFSKEQVKIVA